VIGRTRALICRTPDGRRYIVATTPRRPAQEPAPQPASDRASAPEPTPNAARRPKLTERDVWAIRADYATGGWTQADLAYIHGVTQNTIHRVVRGLVDGIKTQPNQQES
jgi:hypothetical protein